MPSIAVNLLTVGEGVEFGVVVFVILECTLSATAILPGSGAANQENRHFSLLQIQPADVHQNFHQDTVKFTGIHEFASCSFADAKSARSHQAMALRIDSLSVSCPTRPCSKGRTTEKTTPVLPSIPVPHRDVPKMPSRSRKDRTNSQREYMGPPVEVEFLGCRLLRDEARRERAKSPPTSNDDRKG